MKKILFILLLCLSIFLIYHITNKESKLIFSIGNETGDIYYVKDDMYITEIIMRIEQNEIIGDMAIQQILVKASTIEIDANAFFKLTSHEGIASQVNDLEKLFSLLRKYSKEKIQIILINEENDLTEYANNKISILSSKYDIIIKR